MMGHMSSDKKKRFKLNEIIIHAVTGVIKSVFYDKSIIAQRQAKSTITHF